MLVLNVDHEKHIFTLKKYHFITKLDKNKKLVTPKQVGGPSDDVWWYISLLYLSNLTNLPKHNLTKPNLSKHNLI